MTKPLNKPAKTWLQEDLQTLRLTHPPKDHRALAAGVLLAWPPGPNATLRGWSWEATAAYQRLSQWLRGDQ